MTDKTLTVRISAEDHGKIIWKLEQLAECCDGFRDNESRKSGAHFRALAEAMRSGVQS